MFEIGEPVVCIFAGDTQHPKSKCCGFRLVQGAIYHVADFGPFSDGDGVWVDLAEDPTSEDDTAWEESRFRPLRTNEQEAREAWTEMLRNPQKVDA